MSAKQAKLLIVPFNGQISIGKSWAGKQIRVEEIGQDEIRISSGIFVPDSQAIFYTAESKAALSEFNSWEAKSPSKATDTKALFASLRKKK